MPKRYGPAKVMLEIEIIDRGGNTGKEVSWSDLPNDLLCEIFSRLPPRIRVVFQSICRSWNAVGEIVSQRFELPLCLEYSKYPDLMFSNNRIFNPLFEECRHMGYPDIKSAAALSSPSYEKFHHMDFLDVPDAVIRVAKDGWLLMSTDSWAKVFFFNPFMKDKIELPLIDDACVMSMYFSLPPTSPDWFVVVIAINDDDNDIGLYTIKCGDVRWGYCRYPLNGNLFRSFCNAVALEGMYYFLGVDAKLLIHDPMTQQFYFHEAPESIRRSASGGDQYMLVTDDGKLLVVFEGHDGSSISVCQWNLSNKRWEAVESLGDNVLFVSRAQSLCTKAIIKGTENRIYFPRLVGSHCLFYSLTTKRLHTSTFSMDTCYQNFIGIEEFKNATWMI